MKKDQAYLILYYFMPGEGEVVKNKWAVLKFGGSSVENASCWRNISQIIRLRRSQDYRLVVVCSAISGVSNLLDKLISQCQSQEQSKIILEDIYLKHQQLCDQLEVSIDDDLIASEFQKLRNLAQGLNLLQHCSPNIKAQMMSIGEMLLTKIGFLWLKKQAFKTRFLDIKQHLVCEKEDYASEYQHFLNARCNYASDEHFKTFIEELDAEVILTQGFLASDHKNQTVLLGRGGSDTSAAYIGSKIDATRVEIWTDVPGMFTANPKEISSAKLILSLNYHEAQELATSGAKVLHPRCIEPLRARGIPLYIGWTQRPEYQGMKVDQHAKGNFASVKAVIAKRNIQMISMDSIGMWHEVGFLAKVFDCFKKHSLSIDLVTTSQSNVTVTLDTTTNLVNSDDLEGLCDDLSKICKLNIQRSLASVSLVGSHIRSILHLVSPVFKAFEDRNVYLISQSASDLNLTFLVDSSDVDHIVQKIHAMFFDSVEEGGVFGPSWEDLFTKTPVESFEEKQPWWRKEKDKLIDIAKESSPTYVYHLDVISEAILSLKDGGVFSRVNFAMKANSHPKILNLIYAHGLGFDCVSIEEIKYLFDVIPGIDGSSIFFSPNFVGLSEYQQAFERSCAVTLDNLDPIVQYPELFVGKEIFLRFDPEVSKGHHKYVKTAGKESKFGISMTEMEHVLRLRKELNLKIIGLHVHVGSGIRSAHTWADNAYFLEKIARHFPEAKVLNLGGGFGIVEKPGHRPLNIELMKQSLEEFKKAFPKFELWIEPGRFLVANSGVLLTEVTQLKEKGDKKFVGVNAGMNSLLRPALYGSYHEIVNLSKLDDKLEIIADVVGPICESGDVLGYQRSLPKTLKDDVLLISTAGAYGREMASEYNKRRPAGQIIL